VIIIVDYGIGNLGSIINMFKRVGCRAERSSDRDVIAAADRLVLPGVGAIDPALQRLDELDLRGPLTELVVEKKKPILGICLGMQIMAQESEEGERRGFGWIDGKVKKFSFPTTGGVKAPHMGWNYVDASNPHSLNGSLGDGARFYFVHGYHFVCHRPQDVMMTAHYGGMDFTAAIAHDNIVAVQFHPEKSHRYGMALLKGFSKWTPERVEA